MKSVFNLVWVWKKLVVIFLGCVLLDGIINVENDEVVVGDYVL